MKYVSQWASSQPFISIVASLHEVNFWLIGKGVLQIHDTHHLEVTGPVERNKFELESPYELLSTPEHL